MSAGPWGRRTRVLYPAAAAGELVWHEGELVDDPRSNTAHVAIRDCASGEVVMRNRSVLQPLPGRGEPA